MADVQEGPEIAMKNVRPFYARATVSESPVDEEQRKSGLVIPLRHDGSDRFRRGVLLEVATEPSNLGADSLQPGMVVYYQHGTKIGDVTVVELADILAYEDA